MGSSPERAFGKRRIWSFKTKVRVTALVLFLLAGCGAGLAWLLMREPEPKVVAGPDVEVKLEFSESAAKERWVGPSPRRIVDSFLDAGNDEERLKWVRDPEKVGAVLKEWYAQGAGNQERVAKVVPLEAPRVNSRLNLDAPYEHSRFSANMKDGGRRLLSIVSTPDGGKLDFACYIRQCSAPWPAILSGEAVEADVRVEVMPDAYHNFNYLDEEQWRSYVLSSPELEERIYLYARTDFPDLKEMPRGWLKEPKRMFLRIKHTSRENLSRRQFELVKIIANGWTE